MIWHLLRFGFGLLFAGLAWQAQAHTIELREAQAVVTVAGQTIQLQTVSLPYHWDRQQPGLAGEATFELAFDLPHLHEVPYSLYLPRLGNAYEIWLNGSLLQRNGDLQHHNGADYAKTPHYVVISQGLQRRSNLIRVHIRADVGRRGGLAPLILGPTDEVYPLYLRDYRWRSTGSFVVVIVSLLLALLTLTLWATQLEGAGLGGNQRDPLYLLACLAELFWTIRVGDVMLENPPLAWPAWGVVTTVAAALWVVCLALFCVEVAGWSRLPGIPWLRRWLALLPVASLCAATAALVYGYPLALTLLYAALLITALVLAALFIWSAIGHSSLPHRLVAATVFVNILVGLRDWYVFRFSPDYGGNTYQRYSVMLFGLTLGYIVIMRFHAASRQARDLMANLTTRVAQKEQELDQTYQRAGQLTREQDRSTERTRILRDMHDGVGAHISTAIRQLESGRASQGEVLHTLRDSLDHLKLSIDAMNLPQGDITAMLANLRYRLEPRLKTSAIELQWDVDLLPPLAKFDDKAMRQLQFMVYEALSNVMQHARASTLCIELRARPQGGAQLRMIDNGCGFEPERVAGKGLGSLRERANAISADLHIASSLGGTVVEIVLHEAAVWSAQSA